MAKKILQKLRVKGELFRNQSVFIRLVLILLAVIGDAVILCSKIAFFHTQRGLPRLQRFASREIIKISSFLVSLGLFLATKRYLLQKIVQRLLHPTWVRTFISTTAPDFAYKMVNKRIQKVYRVHLLEITDTRKTSFIRRFNLFPLLRALRTRRTIAPRITRTITPKSRLLLPHLSFRFRLPKLRLRRLHFPRIPTGMVGFVLGITLTILILFIPYNIYLFIKLLPNPHLLSHRFIPVTTQIFDRNDTLLYEIHGDEDRKPVALNEIPQNLKEAVIAIEDKDFYHHAGFSVTGIMRAARETMLKNNVQGGSTITQQLIKTALLTPEVTITRKAREVVLAFWAERIYTKDQILEMYLNQAPFGGTTWGIEAASERYFNKSAKDLTLAESAFLAGLPASPTYYSPYGSRPELALERQHEVLRRMIEEGYITSKEAEEAKNTKLTIHPSMDDIKAPHFVMYIRSLLTQKYGARLVDLGGLRVKTTLDLPLQEKTQEIVSRNIADLEKLKVSNGAALITNPTNGDILAMVGSRNYFDDAREGNVNVTLQERQPGSSIKPITYAAALENGLTAMSFIDDSPISYAIAGQPSYAPVNYDGKFHGRVTMRTALANSYNIPAVKVTNQIGVKTLINMGKRMGISTWNEDNRFGLSLTLGGGEVRMVDMAVVYGVMANGGKRVDLDPFLEITDYAGRVYYKRGAPNTIQVISQEIAFILSDILADNSARSLAFGTNSTLNIPGKTVSVKTGTTDNKRDNWTIGYTPSHVVTVWVGNNNNTPMDPALTSGITGAAPIWNQIMTYLVKDTPNEKLATPANLVQIKCGARQEYFVRGTEPKNGCPRFPLSTTHPVIQARQ